MTAGRAPAVCNCANAELRVPTRKLARARRKFACYMWEGYRRHTGPELHTGGMRGSKPAGFSSTGEYRKFTLLYVGATHGTREQS